MIDLLLLGAGAMFPLPDRWLSSLLARCRGEMTLFDCGEGTQIPWRQHGWGFRRVGAICLSHWHADHVAGLPGVLHSLANAERAEPVTLYGPEGRARVVSGLRQIAPHLPFAFEVRELTGGERVDLPGGLRGVVLLTDHRVPCLAYRIEIDRAPRFDPERARALGIPIELWRTLQQGQPAHWPNGAASPEDVLGPPRHGLAFGFVTDTRPTEAMPEFLRNVDLLVCEGTYGDDADRPKAIRHQHMTFAEAASIAAESGARALLLTHFSPAMEDPAAWLANATAIFPETTIGASGWTTRLAFKDDASSGV